MLTIFLTKLKDLWYNNIVTFQFDHSRDVTREIIIKNVENLSLWMAKFNHSKIMVVFAVDRREVFLLQPNIMKRGILIWEKMN